MGKKLLVIGAGGHCRVVLSILEYYDNFEVIGIADRGQGNIGEEISGNSIVCSWNDLEEICHSGVGNAVIAIGNNEERKDLFSRASIVGFKVPTIAHPSAVIEKGSSIGEGCTVCMGVNVGAAVSIGRNCIVYTGSNLDHEVQIGDDVFIAPGCNIAGRVKIGRGSFIGIGTAIKENIQIGKKAIVGAGSVVIKDVGDHDVVAGVPAKSIKK